MVGRRNNWALYVEMPLLPYHSKHNRAQPLRPLENYKRLWCLDTHVKVFKRNEEIGPCLAVDDRMKPLLKRLLIICAILKKWKAKFSSQIGAFFYFQPNVWQLSSRKRANIGCSRV